MERINEEVTLAETSSVIKLALDTVNMEPAGWFNGGPVYDTGFTLLYTNPSVTPSAPYFNAFMENMKEQKEQETAECDVTDSATISNMLEHLWKDMNMEEDEESFQMSDAERRLHVQQHPSWSFRENSDQEVDTVRDVEASEDERELMEPLVASGSEQRPQTISWNLTQDGQTEDDPDVKKPPNAFILFNREQRPLISKKLNVRDSATISRILSQKWKTLSKKQKSKYTEMADELRNLHFQKFPNWSAKDNYGKKTKRVMATPTSWMEEAEYPPPSKKSRLISGSETRRQTQTAVTELNRKTTLKRKCEVHPEAEDQQAPKQTCAETHTGVEARAAESLQKMKYVKKPANAFMIYMREERTRAGARFKVRDSAQVNQLLGKQWKALSNQEKAKYYKMAEEEKALHSQMNPNWSFRDNYGQKVKKSKL